MDLWLLLRLVDVVTDHPTEDPANHGADDSTLDAVAGYATDDRTRGGSDGRIALRVFHNHLATRRRSGSGDFPTRPVDGSAAAAAAATGTTVGRGARTRVGRAGEGGPVRPCRIGKTVELRLLLLCGQRQIVVERRVRCLVIAAAARRE